MLFVLYAADLQEARHERMSLKNPTSWGGYMQKMSGEIVRMESHDGSALPGVPRYDAEDWSAAARPRRLAMIFDLPSVLRKNV